MSRSVQIKVLSMSPQSPEPLACLALYLPEGTMMTWVPCKDRSRLHAWQSKFPCASLAYALRLAVTLAILLSSVVLPLLYGFPVA